jgi:hypothetical protein
MSHLCKVVFNGIHVEFTLDELKLMHELLEYSSSIKHRDVAIKMKLLVDEISHLCKDKERWIDDGGSHHE